jgi:hypothetical protein
MLDHDKILRFACMALLAMRISCLSGGSAAAAEKNEQVAPSVAKPPEQQEKTFQQTMDDIGKSIADAHDQIEQNILDNVKRFDNFLGDVATETQRKPSYEIRLRSGLRLVEGENLKPEVTFRANIALPKTSKRLSLYISGEDQADSLSPALPEDPGNPGFDRTIRPSARIVNTEFRYSLFETVNHHLFLGAGVRVALPPEPFARSRYQFTHNFSKIFLIRIAETLFAKNDAGLGETTEVTLERLLGKDTLIRLANSATLSQEFHGLEWGSELSWIRALSTKSVITLTGGIYGNTAPSTIATNYRLLARYRRNIFKEWLFYELEPEIIWPRDTDGAEAHRLALTFRLEIQFRNADKKIEDICANGCSPDSPDRSMQNMPLINQPQPAGNKDDNSK